ncbi:MAG: hypothetical protein WD205_01645 [Rhodothermales bacterium]
MRFVAGFLFFLVGCSLLDDSSPTSSTVRLEVEQNDYVAEREIDGPRARYGFDLVVHLYNESPHTLYLQRCRPDTPYPIYAVKPVETENAHDAAYNAVWACPGNGHPFVVRPGMTRTDTLHLSGPNGWLGGTIRHQGIMEGRFRLRYSIGTCLSAADCPLDNSVQRSDVFDVSLAYPDNDELSAYARKMAGTWQWLHSLDESAGRTVWPGTSGNPHRSLEINDEGTFLLLSAGALAAHGRFNLERAGLRRVLRFSVEKGHVEGLARLQYVWLERENTLVLEDTGSCNACLLHTFSRIAR